jgi:hypothetical protein
VLKVRIMSAEKIASTIWFNRSALWDGFDRNPIRNGISMIE